MDTLSKAFILIVCLFISIALIMFGDEKPQKSIPTTTSIATPSATLAPTIIAPIPQRDIVRPTATPQLTQRVPTTRQSTNTTIINNQPQPAPNSAPTPIPTQAPQPTSGPTPILCVAGICL